MPTEPVTVGPPKHPLYALTTYELKDRRRELERSRASLPMPRYKLPCAGNLTR
jgi:hypothetical protein